MSFPVFFLYAWKAQVKMESKLGLEVDGVGVETVDMIAVGMMRREGGQHGHHHLGRYLLAPWSALLNAVPSLLHHSPMAFLNQLFDCSQLHRPTTKR